MIDNHPAIEYLKIEIERALLRELHLENSLEYKKVTDELFKVSFIEDFQFVIQRFSGGDLDKFLKTEYNTDKRRK